MQLLQQWQTPRRKTTKRELLSLIGKLSFAAKVIPAGHLPAEVDRSQYFRQEASPSHLSDGQRQSRHQVVARLLTRMEWSQSHASSRLGAGFRSSAVHRRLWYPWIWSILQQSMVIWKVVQHAARKVNPMEGAICSRSGSSDLGAPMADKEDSSPL